MSKEVADNESQEARVIEYGSKCVFGARLNDSHPLRKCKGRVA